MIVEDELSKLKTIERRFGGLKHTVCIGDVSLVWPIKGLVFFADNTSLNSIKAIAGIRLKEILYASRFNEVKASIVFRKNSIEDKGNEPLVISSLSGFRYIYDLQTHKRIFENELYYNIFRRLNLQPFEILNYSFLQSLDRKRVERILNSKRIPKEAFVSWYLVKRTHQISKKLVKKIDRVKNKKDSILNYVKVFVPEAVMWYLVWEEVFYSNKNIPFLFLVDEYSPFPYFGVVWAKKLGIPSIALQHGIISPNHAGYFHFPEYISESLEDYINHVIPTLTLVQGKYERRLLHKMGYPKKTLKVTGQPRYDFLAYSDYIFNNNKIIERYKLPNNRKYLLWTTQTHGLSYKENVANIVNILKAMKVLRDKYHLIIKLHPGENQNGRLYKNYINKTDFVTIVPGHENTYELLYICEALITKHSTTGIEAIAMGKPILLTEFIKSHDLSMYTDYGFDYILRTPQDLIKYISMIDDGSLVDDFEKKRKKFMEDRLAHFGKATERVAKVLDRFS